MVVFGLAAELLLGFVFIYSSLAKIRLGGFAEDVAGYRLLPSVLVRPVALLLPWVECLVGLLLLGGLVERAALWVAAGLLLVFAAAMTVNLGRGHRNACGCQGTHRPISWLLAGRNVGGVVAAGIVVMSSPPPGLQALGVGRQGLSASTASSVLIVVILAAVALRLGTAMWRLRSQVRGLHAPELIGVGP